MINGFNCKEPLRSFEELFELFPFDAYVRKLLSRGRRWWLKSGVRKWVERLMLNQEGNLQILSSF